MKKYFIPFFFVFFCCTVVSAFAPSPTTINTIKKQPTEFVTVSPKLVQKLQSMKTFNRISLLTVTRDGERVSSMRGDLSSPLQGDIHTAALEYLKENADLFNIPKARNVNFVKTVRFEKVGSYHHVGFQMVIDGVPVYNSNIDLHICPERVVKLANGSFPIINEITNKIAISRYQAIGAARAALKTDKMRAVPDAQLVVVAYDGGLAKIAYLTRLSVEKPLGDWEIIVDAETSKILYINNELAFRTGQGSAYVTHPLDCKPTIEEMPYLTHFTLRGEYAYVTNDNGTDSYNEEDTHIYDPSSEHFNEPNMYSYVNRIHAHFKSLGHDKNDKPMKAIVNYGTDYDNAYFSPWQNLLAFGNGSKLNDLAREASVTFHEYSHAVLHTIVYLTYSAESGAINEGQADYFACSLLDNPKLGVWAVAKMDRPYLRNLDNSYVYPKDIQGEVHHDGKIWGGTLWDIRKALGAKVSDKLIYRSHYFLKSSRATFMDAYNALIMADNELNNGKNLKALEQVMQKRGIVPENYFGAVITGKQLSQMHKFDDAHTRDR